MPADKSIMGLTQRQIWDFLVSNPETREEKKIEDKK